MGSLTTTSGSLFRPLLRDFFDIDRFIEKGLGPDWKGWMPAVNIQENDSSFVLEFVVPGFAKEDLQVQVEDNRVTVSAEKKAEQERAEKAYTHHEYRFQSFSRSFAIPDYVQDDAIEATYNDGVLRLTLPKTKEPITVSKQITVK